MITGVKEMKILQVAWLTLLAILVQAARLNADSALNRLETFLIMPDRAQVGPLASELCQLSGEDLWVGLESLLSDAHLGEILDQDWYERGIRRLLLKELMQQAGLMNAEIPLHYQRVQRYLGNIQADNKSPPIRDDDVMEISYPTDENRNHRGCKRKHSTKQETCKRVKTNPAPKKPLAPAQ